MTDMKKKWYKRWETPGVAILVVVLTGYVWIYSGRSLAVKGRVSFICSCMRIYGKNVKEKLAREESEPVDWEKYTFEAIMKEDRLNGENTLMIYDIYKEKYYPPNFYIDPQKKSIFVYMYSRDDEYKKFGLAPGYGYEISLVDDHSARYALTPP